MLTADLLVLLRQRYPEKAFAFFPQVRPGTGSVGPERYADAVALGLWPSRGIDLHGFELKVSRSDWLRELKDPAKAEAVVQFMDYWHVVVPFADIVKEGELPEGWGLLMPQKGRLEAVVKAARRESLPPTKAFVAGMLRRAAEGCVTQAEVRQAVSRERERVTAEMTERYRNRPAGQGGCGSECRDLRRRVEEFEQASGVSIQYAWNAGGIGEAVKLVVEGNLGRWRQHFEGLRQQVRAFANDMDRVNTGDDLTLTNPNGKRRR